MPRVICSILCVYLRTLSAKCMCISAEYAPVFRRYRERDPYKLLGVDRDASEEEIRSAKDFLVQQYAGHEASEEAIEGAYEKIIMKSYQHRKKTKINLKTKLLKRVEESPSWVKAFLGYFEVPSMDIISKRLFFFAFIAGWSIATSAENGPAFQLAISLFSCIYFLNDKMKNLLRASTTGLVWSTCWWLDCWFYVGPSYPNIYHPTYMVA
uniref:J domain-containing protein n=1 Tax=Aegilops tauschii subsp. strangulata TaxID=200361 RepID=A0A453KR13_AEGTS